MSKKEDAAYVADVIAAWADRYVAASNVTGTFDPVHAQPGTVVVAETGEGKFSQWVSLGGRHVMRADEPKEVGGDETGGTPYDFLLAGLGACTSMTLRMYAAHKGLSLERVSVTLAHDKDYATDCETCEDKGAKIDTIERSIVIEGDLSDGERARLLEIADKCPVHKTLHSEVKITTIEAK